MNELLYHNTAVVQRAWRIIINWQYKNLKIMRCRLTIKYVLLAIYTNKRFAKWRSLILREPRSSNCNYQAKHEIEIY